MEFTHLGWIPCINGHLDFGLMKPSINGGFTNLKGIDKKITSVSYSHSFRNNFHHARRFMMQSKVDWRDTVKINYDGWFRVFLIAESNESDSLDERNLDGHIYIYQAILEPKKRKQRQDLLQFSEIHEAKKKLDNYKKNPENYSWPDVTLQLDQHYENLSNCFQTMQEAYAVRFKVDHNGITYLNIDPSCKVDDETAYVIIRQAFYYLKYSLHEHKHHDNQTDSLTTITPFKNTDEEKSACALKLIGQLKRELTTIKRSYSLGEKVQHSDAQGIISYLNSLIETCYQSKFIDKETKDREKEYLKSVSSSFSAQTKKIDTKESSIEKIRTRNRIVFGWSLSLISILILVFSKFYIRPSKDMVLIDFDISIERFLIDICIISLTIYFIYNRITSHSINKVHNNKRFGIWVNRYYINTSSLMFILKVIATYAVACIAAIFTLYLAIINDKNNHIINFFELTFKYIFKVSVST